MTEPYIPQERDLPAGRLTQLKDDLMTQIEHDLETEQPVAPAVTHRRWRRVGLTAAALAAGLGLAGSLVLGGSDSASASANTAVRTDDGAVLITLREGEDPEALEQRLRDLGVPAEVDFLESGFGCDSTRSTGWVQVPRGEALFTWAPDSPEGEAQLILHPEKLLPGETAVFEFQIDEHGGEIAAGVMLRLSTSPVGPCVPVPNDSIVDAEAGISGG